MAIESGPLQRALALRARLLSVVVRVGWLAPLLGRVSVGLLFMSTGWGKVHSISKVTNFFAQLGIPAPHLNAVVVGYTELLGGALLVLGLCTRLAALPLMVSMGVAILTAKWSELHGILDLVGFDEFTYFTILFILVFIGPGAASLDRIVMRRLTPASVEFFTSDPLDRCNRG